MTSKDNALSLPDREIFAPALVEPLFWRPRFLEPSPVVAHIPFLFWLCHAIRPENVRVVGADDGVAHFALCQAIDKLNLPSRCHGEGRWEDGDQPPVELRDHQAQLYEDTSTLQSRDLTDPGHAAVPPESVDLIFADLTKLDADAVHYEEWLSQLKANGILILHGTADLHARPEYARGLARRIAELPQVRLTAGSGLTLVARSADQPQRLRTLLDVSQDGRLPPEFERVFKRLGDGLDLLIGQTTAATEMSTLRRTLSDEKTKSKATEAKLAETQKAYELRNRVVADLQSAVVDKDQMRTLLAIRDADLADANTRIEALKRSGDEMLAAERQARFRETEVLTRQLEDLHPTTQTVAAPSVAEKQDAKHKQAIALLTNRLERATANLENKRVEIERLKHENKTLKRNLERMAASASWRITAPIRRVKSVIGR